MASREQSPARSTDRSNGARGGETAPVAHTGGGGGRCACGCLLSARLTRLWASPTIAAMQRETLLAILQRADGVSADGDRHRTNDGHQLTVYVGQPGRAVAIDHVLSLQLAPTHIEIEARDRGTFYVSYEAVHALLDAGKNEKKGAVSRAGF